MEIAGAIPLQERRVEMVTLNAGGRISLKRLLVATDFSVSSEIVLSLPRRSPAV
jgi:hypothetical protein